MVPGSPCICIRQTGKPLSAAACKAPSRDSARTSLSRPAPALAASLINTGELVSTEMITSNSAAIRSTSGSTRSISSATDTVTAPGRVDSPPISRMAAPCKTISRARIRARSTSRRAPWNRVPPSEKESGVVLITPIMAGRDKSRLRPAQSSTGAGKEWEQAKRVRPGVVSARRRVRQ